MCLSVKDPLVRFLLKVSVNPLTGCWDWTGGHSGFGRGGGYGRFSISGQTIAAHRWSYAKFKGVIRKKMHIDHLCNNRCCMNPAHLEQVSGTVNQRRKVKRKA